MDSSTSENAAPMPNDLLSSLPESKAQEQARLRRERRNAKIQAGGASRLAQITSLSGRPAAAEAGKFRDLFETGHSLICT